jgi:hypothetical protein
MMPLPLPSLRKSTGGKKPKLLGKCQFPIHSLRTSPERLFRQTLVVQEEDGRASVELYVKAKGSPDVRENYLLIVPLFEEGHGHESFATVTDHTGKGILRLKLNCMTGSERLQDSFCHPVSTVDILGMDGTYKGQVFTDMSDGLYARSRLANNFNIHWATVKCRRKPVNVSPAKGDGKFDMSTLDDVLFYFKVVPTFEELVIVEEPMKYRGQRSFEVRPENWHHLSFLIMPES